MKRATPTTLAVALAIAIPLIGAASDGARSLDGEYRSRHGDGPVSATFTPVGSQLWEVTFDFTFNGRRHTYRGTAEGSFADGQLNGRVENEYGRRTFTFRGDYEDGVFRASHAEVKRGREVDTGSLHLEEEK